MTRASEARRNERKSQLAARAALERMRLTLALHSVRIAVMPPAGERASPLRRPLVAILLGIAAKRVGPARLRRWIRIASFATAAYRIVGNLRR
jgi:hypothetical protein